MNVNWKEKTETAIAARHPQSQYRLARDIGVTDAAVLNWRRGGVPKYEHAVKLLEIAAEGEKKGLAKQRGMTFVNAIIFALATMLLIIAVAFGGYLISRWWTSQTIKNIERTMQKTTQKNPLPKPASEGPVCILC